MNGMDGIAALQALYDRDINFQLSTFWDGGFTVRLGDEMNGFAAQGTFPTLEEPVAWLVSQAAIHFSRP